MSSYLRTGVSALTLSAVILCSPAFSQEGTGVRGNLSFSERVELEDGDFFSRTGLGFGISSATRVETFSLNLGTELFGDFSDEPGKDFSFINESVALRYSRSGGNSRLNFSALYDEVELDDEVITDSGGSSIISTGSAETIAANLGLEFGIEGPVGVTVDIARREVGYTDTTDPDLFDFETTSLDALASFRIRPSLTVRALAGIERTDEDDLTDTSTEETYFGVGVETSTASGMTVRGDILYDRSETTVTGPTTTTDDGVGIELAVVQSRPNGSIEFALSSRIDDAGRRTSAEVRRGYDLRNGALALSLGVVDQEGDDNLRLIGGVRVERETRRGSVTASLAQGATTSDGDAVISTVVDLGIAQEINSVSGWSAGLGFVATDEIGGEYDDRKTATISYTRNLTADWDLSAGIEYSKDRGESSTNTVFVGIERDFTFGF